MSKNLNQAFIKAYSRERADEAKRQEESAQAEQDQLMVRVDTSSVEIPAPHMLKPRRGRVAVTQRVDSEQTSSATAPRSVAHDQSNDEPRSEQPLDSGAVDDWNASFNTLIAGFPTIASEPISAVPPTPGINASASAGDHSPDSNAADRLSTDLVSEGRSDERLPDAPQESAPAMPLQPTAPETISEPAEPAVEANATIEPLEDVQADVEQVAAEGTDTEKHRDQNEQLPPALEAPITPALSYEEVERAVGEYADQRRGRGEIFRLDRPSYAPETAAEIEEKPPAVPEIALSEDSESIEIDAEDSYTEADIATTAAIDSATREVEDGLRKARLRIFNPVWEVDNFQWPDVCVELLRQREENMAAVAKNLLVACQEGLQVLAVTSPQGGEGRTTVACCLAMLAGSHGLNVAIVDGDIENPTLTFQTNLDVEGDWKTAVMQQTPLEEVAVHSIDDQVTLLPLLQPIEQREMASDDNRIAFMLHELSESFDLVIVDMGHMESTRSLVTSMGEQGIISAVVTVVDRRNTTPQRVEACLRRIKRTGITSIGLVENFAA